MAVAWLGVALAGCGNPSTKPPGDLADKRPALLIPAAPGPVGQDQCDAKSLASLIGKPRESLPVAVQPAKRRVSCSTCPMADDYRRDRTDVVFDARTGLILSIRCG